MPGGFPSWNICKCVISCSASWCCACRGAPTAWRSCRLWTRISPSPSRLRACKQRWSSGKALPQRSSTLPCLCLCPHFHPSSLGGGRGCKTHRLTGNDEGKPFHSVQEHWSAYLTSTLTHPIVLEPLPKQIGVKIQMLKSFSKGSKLSLQSDSY